MTKTSKNDTVTTSDGHCVLVKLHPHFNNSFNFIRYNINSERLERRNIKISKSTKPKMRGENVLI